MCRQERSRDISIAGTWIHDLGVEVEEAGLVWWCKAPECLIVAYH